MAIDNVDWQRAPTPDGAAAHRRGFIRGAEYISAEPPANWTPNERREVERLASVSARRELGGRTPSCDACGGANPIGGYGVCARCRLTWLEPHPQPPTPDCD